jgi:Tol biopolymer transport system component
VEIEDYAGIAEPCFEIPVLPIGFWEYEDEYFQYTNPQYNPNSGDEFVFLRADRINNKTDLCLYNLITRQFRVLVSDILSGPPKWSTKDWILFANSDYNLYKIKSSGDGLTQLTAGGINHDPEWSPDGTQFLFIQSPNLYLADENGIISDTLIWSTENPAWAPDNSCILFSSSYYGAEKSGIVKYDLKTREYALIYNQPNRGTIDDHVKYLSWLPNSKEFVWTDGRGLYISDVDHFRKRKIKAFCPNHWYQQISVSPEGESIIADKIILEIKDETTLLSKVQIVKLPIDAYTEQIILE